MITPLKFLLLAGLLSGTVSSCCQCSETPVQIPFEVRDFSLLNIDNFGPQPVFSESESLSRHSFGFALVFPSKTNQSVLLNDVYPLAPFAPLCCSKGEPTQWKIEYIRIHTVYDFDALHLAGSEVSEFFKIVNSRGGSLFYSSLEDMGTGVFHNSFDSNDNFVLPVLLMNPPSAATEAAFKAVVKFRHHDEEFEGVTNSVLLR